jgi:uncharacterized protein YndB with AHSA1/START domain
MNEAWSPSAKSLSAKSPSAQPAAHLLPPVKKSITVGIPVEEAFRLFTDGIHTWWPLASHSVGEERAESCVLEPRRGGRFYEVMKDGSEADWGEVLSWEPPRRFVTTWHPGREGATAQELEVVFTAEGEGTRVDLTHSNWELLGERAEEARLGYVKGWDYVLGLYIARAG